MIILKEGITDPKVSTYCCFVSCIWYFAHKMTEIEIRQLLFLKKILDKNEKDPVPQVHQEMIKYDSVNNWANNVLDLWIKYSLPLNDENKCVCKSMVKNKLKPMHFLH